MSWENLAADIADLFQSLTPTWRVEEMLYQRYLRQEERRREARGFRCGIERRKRNDKRRERLRRIDAELRAARAARRIAGV